MAEREILFRGKRTYNGKWVEGSLVVTSQGGAYIISTVEDKRDATVLVNQCSLNVDPETVGQYTGLTDKNGVRIFEGDIVRYDVNYHDMVISYDVENWGGWLYEDMDDNMQAYSIYEFCLKDIAVVGNIHDNPEILKGGEDNG